MSLSINQTQLIERYLIRSKEIFNSQTNSSTTRSNGALNSDRRIEHHHYHYDFYNSHHHCCHNRYFRNRKSSTEKNNKIIGITLLFPALFALGAFFSKIKNAFSDYNQTLKILKLSLKHPQETQLLNDLQEIANHRLKIDRTNYQKHKIYFTASILASAGAISLLASPALATLGFSLIIFGSALACLNLGYHLFHKDIDSYVKNEINKKIEKVLGEIKESPHEATDTAASPNLLDIEDDQPTLLAQQPAAPSAHPVPSAPFALYPDLT